MTLQKNINRFIKLNSRMREATLESEREFLKLAGNISAAQLQIILSIGEHQPISMSKLATILHFSKPNITQMVEKLIANKYVKKHRRSDDQRIVEVSLLTKGKAIVELNRDHVERVAKKWFKHMSAQQQTEMLDVWEKFFND